MIGMMAGGSRSAPRTIRRAGVVAGARASLLAGFVAEAGAPATTRARRALRGALRPPRCGSPRPSSQSSLPCLESSHLHYRPNIR